MLTSPRATLILPEHRNQAKEEEKPPRRNIRSSSRLNNGGRQSRRAGTEFDYDGTERNRGEARAQFVTGLLRGGEVAAAGWLALELAPAHGGGGGGGGRGERERGVWRREGTGSGGRLVCTLDGNRETLLSRPPFYSGGLGWE